MRAFSAIPLLFLTSPAFAESGQPSLDGTGIDYSASDDEDILVIATRIRGQVDTDQPPIMTLDEDDIASYGAASIGELLEAVSPQTGSGRDRGGGHPIILLNGQRISSFRQLRDIPPEAIRRMEVLPEEVALRFGYPPDQRIVNFILKDKFSTVLLAGEYNFPTRGGFAESEMEAGLVRFEGPSRFSLNWKMEDTSPLTEAERGIVQQDGSLPDVLGDPDPAAYRSLVPDSVTHTVNGSWTNGFGKDGLDGSVTVDALVSRKDSRSLSGLETVLLTAPSAASALRSIPEPLARTNRTDTFEAGFTLNKPVGAWQLAATLDSSLVDATTHIDRRRDLSGLAEAAAAGSLAIDGPLPDVERAGFDTARQKDFSLSSLLTVNGRPFRMPAGEASLTFDAGYDHLSSRNRDTRGSGIAANLKRDTLSAGANLALPITSRREGIFGGIGDITFNVSGGIDHPSDFRTLYDWSVGLTWSPAENLSFNASYIVNEEAPGLSELGQAEIRTFNVPVYDFARDETALVEIVSGGNASLLAEKQRDIKLSANWDLPFFRSSSLVVEYFRNRSDDVTRSFPLLTQAVELAFPERVKRDGTGSLTAIDRRPVTFDTVRSSNLRWGLNLSGSIKREERDTKALQGGGPRSGFGGAGRHGGRWNVALYHSWRFTDEVRIAAGSPVFDQLSGEALVEGGVPRHSLELEGGVFNKGVGVRFNGSWSAPATVSGSNGGSDLRFGSVLGLDMRVFINLGEKLGLVERIPFLKGVRVAFDFDNIFDSRQKVTDAQGLVPLAYQAAYRDPRGRFAGIDIKKSF